eukprot:6480556-Amphidinium_carterae.1
MMLATSPAQTAPVSLAQAPALRGVTQVVQQHVEHQFFEQHGCRSLVVATSAAVATALTVGSARKARRAGAAKRTARAAFRSERIPVEGRKLRVAVVGGGPGGACAAETLAKAGIETFLIERKLDNCKPCGGAIPLCMLEEFNLPTDIVDRQVRKMTMISPTNKEVQIGQTLKDDEFIGMVRRE